MAKKKNKYIDKNASLSDKDNFGIIFEGMLKSKAFQNLSLSAKQFYICCRVQAQSEKGRRCLYEHGKAFDREYNANTDFVFPSSHISLYGYKRQNAHDYIRELKEGGFLIVKEDNSKQRLVNVYSFSDKWKNSS